MPYLSKKSADLLLTAVAPVIWGSTYIVTTQFLPAGYPITVAMLRALPAGLLLLLFARSLPHGIWWMRIFILGAFNFAFFWVMLFVSAYRLPGGVAATVGAVQPLIVIVLARLFLGRHIRLVSIIAACIGLFGVALLVLAPGANLDAWGIAAGLAGAVSMAFGTVLTRLWQPPVSLSAFTAWQLTAGGLLLVPIAFLMEPALPALTVSTIAGLVWLSVIGAALSYVLWFRGITRLEPSVVSSLGFLSPMTAVLLGWIVLHQSMSLQQICGVLFVLAGIVVAQRSMVQAG